MKDQAPYTVGTTDDNRVQLSFHHNGTTVSMTMNAIAVRHMIRMLEAALPEREFEEYAEDLEDK